MVAMLPATIAARVRLVPLDFDLRVVLFTPWPRPSRSLRALPAPRRVTLTEALRGQLTAPSAARTLRNLLIIGQVTVSLVLLIVATTIVRNGAAIRGIDLGMQTAGVISMRENRAATRPRSAAATSR